MSNRDDPYFRLGRQRNNHSPKHSGDKFKHYASYDEFPFIMGYNRSYPNMNKTVHAEVDFVEKLFKRKGIKAGRRIKIKHFIVGRDGNSRPCINCINYLNKYLNIDKISFTNNDGSWTTMSFSKLIQEENQYVTRGDRIYIEEDENEDPEKRRRYIVKYRN
jgi:hypothetical protein